MEWVNKNSVLRIAAAHNKVPRVTNTVATQADPAGDFHIHE